VRSDECGDAQPHEPAHGESSRAPEVRCGRRWGSRGALRPGGEARSQGRTGGEQACEQEAEEQPDACAITGRGERRRDEHGGSHHGEHARGSGPDGNEARVDEESESRREAEPAPGRPLVPPIRGKDDAGERAGQARLRGVAAVPEHARESARRIPEPVDEGADEPGEGREDEPAREPAPAPRARACRAEESDRRGSGSAHGPVGLETVARERSLGHEEHEGREHEAQAASLDSPGRHEQKHRQGKEGEQAPSGALRDRSEAVAQERRAKKRRGEEERCEPQGLGERGTSRRSSGSGRRRTAGGRRTCHERETPVTTRRSARRSR
jgi:hypothetical protein